MTLLAASLASISAACAAAAVFYRPLLGSSAAARRMREITAGTPVANGVDTDEQRRALLASRLEQLARRERERRRPPLRTLITQAGFAWTPRQVVLGAVAIGCGAAAGVFSMTGNPLLALPAGAGAAYLIPSAVLKRARARRQHAFVRGLPDALTALASSRRAGSDLDEAIKHIVRDAQEPVRSEFRVVAEEVALGSTLADALDRLAIRMPVEEARFLALAIAIQADEGGRLVSALMSLAETIRQRAQLADKLRAMTADTRFAALVLTLLPVGMTALSYQRDPQATALLWTTSVGQMVLVGSGIWIAIGYAIMTKIQKIDG